MEEAYTKYIQEWGKVERKGKNNPYTSLNGHMFTFIDKKNEYLAIRLSPEDQKAFVEEFKTRPVIQYNSVMNGYVEVPESLFEEKAEVFEWLDKSHAFISGIKPKPSKKNK
jgi:hypothetical protein